MIDIVPINTIFLFDTPKCNTTIATKLNMVNINKDNVLLSVGDIKNKKIKAIKPYFCSP